MKTAKVDGHNKHHQTHTNTLNTKTIRFRSWIPSNMRGPATTAVVIGILLFSASMPAVMSSLASDANTSPEVAGVMSVDTEAIESLSETVSTNDSDPEVPDKLSNDAEASGATGSNSNVSIQIEMNSSSSGDSGGSSGESPTPTVKINGQTVELPASGRINERIEDDHSSTRVRGRVSTDGGSSVNISTNSSYDSEGE